MARKTPPAKKAARKAAKTPAKSKAKAAVKAPAKKAPAARTKAQRLEVFVREYLVDFNGARAARAAGASARSARVQASEWLARPEVQQLIQAQVDARKERLVVEADEVAQRYWALATADPNELIEMRRVCCRFCYGKGHHYQFTARELDRAIEEHVARCENNGIEPPPFKAPGGIGYDPRKNPHPDCPECFGEGTERPFPKDTRDLSPQARMLYAGVKVTKDGLQVLMHDQIAAMNKFAQSIGMFKQKVELTGKDGGPVEHSLTDVLAELDGADTGIGPASSRG